MKIAYLLGSLNRGGTETLVLDVFRNSQKNKLNTIGIYRKSGVLENEFQNSGVRMIKLSVDRNPIAYILKLRKILLSNKITVAHAQQPIDALYALFASVGTGINVILTFHGYDFADKGLSKTILRVIIQRTFLNVYVSDTQRNYYQEKYNLKPEKQKVVYNGISFDKLDVALPFTQGVTLSRTPSLEKLCTELNLSSETILIGAVGNFNDVRDQLSICRFLDLLHKNEVSFHFVFAGKRVGGQEYLYDSCVDFCKTNGLSKYVSFLGVRSDIPSILNQLDAFVYSTDHDTFGIAVVEAMAVGVPVFVNDWGVMCEITGNGKYATLYKSKNEHDLLREFMLFLQNKDIYQTKAAKAAEFVRESYSIEKHIEELKMIYSSTSLKGLV